MPHPISFDADSWAEERIEFWDREELAHEEYKSAADVFNAIINCGVDCGDLWGTMDFCSYMAPLKAAQLEKTGVQRRSKAAELLRTEGGYGLEGS